jgi:hypothetical protein
VPNGGRQGGFIVSAWRIGSDAQQRVAATVNVTIPRDQVADAALPNVTGTLQPATPAQGTADLVSKAADIYTKWIPGDVLAIFLALTTAFRGTITADATDKTTPHAWGILIAGLALAAGLTLLGAISANMAAADVATNAKWKEIAARMVLAAMAFGFWSLATPGAWWEVKKWNAGVLAAIAFAISIVFAFVAEITVAIVKKYLK